MTIIYVWCLVSFVTFVILSYKTKGALLRRLNEDIFTTHRKISTAFLNFFFFGPFFAVFYLWTWKLLAALINVFF